MEDREGEVRGKRPANGQDRFDLYGADGFLEEIVRRTLLLIAKHPGTHRPLTGAETIKKGGLVLLRIKVGPAPEGRDSLAQRVSAGWPVEPYQAPEGRHLTRTHTEDHRAPPTSSTKSKLLLEAPFPMMFFLAADVTFYNHHLRRTHTERSKSLLPCKRWGLVPHPPRRIRLKIAHHV
jgi:hypothetical protein